MNSNTVKKTWVENCHLSPSGHLLTAELAGKAVRLHYQSGPTGDNQIEHVLDQATMSYIECNASSSAN